MVRGHAIAATAAAVFSVSALPAQERKQEPELVIPAAAMPPEGMCRVWLRNVPERQQPAPTDCASAIRTRPRDAILLLGEPARNAKLPPRRPDSATRPGAFDDPFPRRQAANLMNFGTPGMSDGRGRTTTAATNTRVAAPASSANPVAAVAPGASAAAMKAPDAKASGVVKPPEPPPQ